MRSQLAHLSSLHFCHSLCPLCVPQSVSFGLKPTKLATGRPGFECLARPSIETSEFILDGRSDPDVSGVDPEYRIDVFG
jgi:hypothetical protein